MAHQLAERDRDDKLGYILPWCHTLQCIQLAGITDRDAVSILRRTPWGTFSHLRNDYNIEVVIALAILAGEIRGAACGAVVFCWPTWVSVATTPGNYSGFEIHFKVKVLAPRNF